MCHALPESLHRQAREEEQAMTDYVLLYRGGGMPETEEDQAIVMKAWDGWMHQLGPALKDGGNPFAPGAAKTITSDGRVRDGAGSASGYSILTADSLEAATEMAKGCPVLQGGAEIEVYEIFPVM